MLSDPESRARPLALAGSALAVVGLYAGGWGWLAFALGVGLLLLACVSRRDGFLLLGPYPGAEGRRHARRGRAHWPRVVLMVGVGLVVSSAMGPVGNSDLGSADGRWQFRRASNELLAWCGVALPIAGAVLSVVGVAGVVAEERANKRWDVLLATDLRPREIVFGKVLSRAFGVLGLASAVLPVVLVLGVVGLVPVAAVLPGAAFVGGAVLALAGLTAWAAVTRVKPGRAAAVAVGIAFLYLVLSALLCLLRFPFPAEWGVPDVWAAPGVPELVAFLNAANPFTTMGFLLGWGPAGDETFLAALPEAARRFLAGSLALFLWGTLTACRRLRAVGDAPPRVPLARRVGALTGRALRMVGLLKRRHGGGPADARPVDRPAVTDEPLAWWAAERDAPPSRRLARPATARVVGVWFAAALAAFALCHVVGGVAWWVARAEELAGFLLFAAFAVGGVSLFAVVTRAARLIPAERDGDTIETLRLSPLTPRDVVTQFRRGALARYRSLYPRLAAVLAAAVVAGFAPWRPTALALVLAWVVPPAWAGWALALSARATTPGRGVRNALLGGFVLHYLLALAVGVPVVTAADVVYRFVLGGRGHMVLSELLWWDWLLEPRSWRSRRDVVRILWPVGPVVGLAVAGGLLWAYHWFGRVMLRFAAARLARDWLPEAPLPAPPLCFGEGVGGWGQPAADQAPSHPTPQPPPRSGEGEQDRAAAL